MYHCVIFSKFLTHHIPLIGSQSINLSNWPMTIDNDTVTLTGYTGKDKDVIIPLSGDRRSNNTKCFFSFIGLLLAGVCFVAINKKIRIQKR